ncbi:OadG family transporter subunit [Aliarcobacter lanthieri]|uniref:OadG family protein n=1 Tax=Aliarcobacter lanthieri TaxID=1355374 RepID=UPI00047EEC06|nr:OadG family protein [Aliarcobacter lanthieri]
MESLIQAITSFFIVMGVVSTILLIVGFILKAKGVSFVEFFPEKEKLEIPAPNIIYNTITNPSVSNSSIDAKKVAAIMAAIEHHNKVKG